MSTNHPIEIYRQKIAEANTALEINKKQSNRYALIRLTVFILAIPLIYFLLKTSIVTFILSFILIAAVFIWAVVVQQSYDKKVKEAERLLAINENEIACLQNFDNLYYNGDSYDIHGHEYTDDLDIFGPHSLFGLINRAKTFHGNQILKDYFLRLPSTIELSDRQEAIKEIAEDLDWRQNLALQLMPLENAEKKDVIQAIDSMLNMDLTFARDAKINLLRKALPFIWLGLIGLYFILPSAAQSIAAILFIYNLSITGKHSKTINIIQGRLAQVGEIVRGYIASIKIVFDKKWKSKYLKEAYAPFQETEAEIPIKSLKDFDGIIDHLDYRLNFLVAIVANGLFLWDIGVVYRLATWKEEQEGSMKAVFQHIGLMEALSSLATWAYNHPDYAYATIHETYMNVEAENIRHPLIPINQNVANDFELQPKDEITIITGSNMSGKSTFLRTIGINMILGYTGTKVAADKLDIPIVSIVTYMRIKDALEESVSTFKAELNRISLILDLLQKENKTFILIDEMLRGTNSKDKLQGSIGIVNKLLAANTFAMIATHDIKLAEMGKKESRIANYFFDIDYKDGDLVFDYKIKKGICENFNASFLLSQLGIDVGDS